MNNLGFTEDEMTLDDLDTMIENGWACDRCGKPWKKKRIKLDEIEHDFYISDCTCYPRCPYCNRWLIYEVKNKMGGCRHCGKDGINCWKENYVTDEEGEIIPGKYAKCTGILKLQPTPEEGYTVFKCSKCNNVMKRKIIV